jgi:hypothetical protein
MAVNRPPGLRSAMIGVPALTRSKSSRSRGMLSSWAMASRCVNAESRTLIPSLDPLSGCP